MNGEAVADPLARTVLAWQRLLLVLAGLAVLVAVALSRSGHPGWGLLVLPLALIPLPAVLARQRALLAGGTSPAPATLLVLVTAAAAALALVALIAVVAG